MRHRSTFTTIRFITFTVSHIHTVSCNRAIDILTESRVWHCCQVYSPKSSLRWSLRRTKSSNTPSRSTGLAECATRIELVIQPRRPRFNRDGLLCAEATFSTDGARWTISRTQHLWQGRPSTFLQAHKRLWLVRPDSSGEHHVACLEHQTCFCGFGRRQTDLIT